MVFLLAGVSWCRPCKGLTKPMERLAERYAEGAIFLKILGDENDNTKRYFRGELGVTATPALFAWRRGQRVYTGKGGNKCKVEGAVRRYYDTEAYTLPPEPLYARKPQELKLRPAALMHEAFPS